MPFFQYDGYSEDSTVPEPGSESRPQPLARPYEPTLARKLSEESIRTEFCEGPLLDSPLPAASALVEAPEKESLVSKATSDRAELIERLKRGESPTWVPNRHLESILNQHGPIPTPRTPRSTSDSPGLLPAADITPEKVDESLQGQERLQDGLSIERPRSALHSGDFTPEEHSPTDLATQTGNRGGPEAFLTSRHSWIATSPPRDYSPFSFDRRSSLTSRPADPVPGVSSLSSSLSSSFVYKHPTSPLVQSLSNEDMDLSVPLSGIEIAGSKENPRRHTLSFSHSSSFAVPPPPSSTPTRRPFLHRREGSLPYQAHQPRRSLNSTPSFNLLGSSPQTPPFLRSRRPSFGSDASPLQASMVGSYEESILRGRMSTHPSKPLDFMAQIGVLGLGKCKASLRCPPHVTLPFPAVFYSYSSTSHVNARSEDGPSPYVGQIDLENGLPNQEEGNRARRKLNSRYGERKTSELDVDMLEDEHNGLGAGMEVRRPSARSKQRSGSPKAPPGGSYRIPEKGQIQIVIKNQNKTAVKLFLVPYDLAGMEPGTKTFIRQRSYSAGPTIDVVATSSSLSATAAAAVERPILRYLVHLHICCPARGRFYLYKSVRIVFANRVPDGKEKLRNETTWPEPRFSPYKPIRVMHPPSSSGGAGAVLAADKAFRRRSSGWTFGVAAHGSGTAGAAGAAAGGDDVLDAAALPASSQAEQPPVPSLPSLLQSFDGGAGRGEAASFGDGRPQQTVDPIPFRLPSRAVRLGSDVSDSTDTTATGLLLSPDMSGRDVDDVQMGSSPPSPPRERGNGAVYEKLSRGDVGYGGNAFVVPAGRHGGGPAAEGLLSQRLRSLGVRGPASASASMAGKEDVSD